MRNWGRGFHSNDARGVVNSDPDFQVPGLVRGTGSEGGVRFEFGTLKFTTTPTGGSTSHSELIFVGDSNAVEPKSGGKRHGLELVGVLEASGLAGHRCGLRTHSRTLQGIPATIRMSATSNPRRKEAVESAGELGISAVARRSGKSSGRLRYLGPYRCTERQPKRADAEAMVNLRLAYKFSDTSRSTASC